MTNRIEDYALIRDCETAALVGKDGSSDWLCWPRFDSDACVAALIGNRDSGRWQVAWTARPTEAEASFEQLLALCTDVGFSAEESHSQAGRMRGNVPPGCSRLALLNAAINLAGRDMPAEQRQKAFLMERTAVSRRFGLRAHQGGRRE